MPEVTRMKRINTHYDTVSKLIASHKTQRIGICSDDKYYYVHYKNEIYFSKGNTTMYRKRTK